MAPAGHLGDAPGGPLDADGTVEFAAHYRSDGERGVQRENSRFQRIERRWYYLDGDVG